MMGVIGFWTMTKGLAGQLGTWKDYNQKIGDKKV